MSSTKFLVSTKKSNLNNYVSSIFDDFFRDPFGTDILFEPRRCLPHNIITNDYPPANIYAEKKDDNTSVYTAELAVAGYKKSEISVNTKHDKGRDYIVVTLGTKPEKPSSLSKSEESLSQEDGSTSSVEVEEESDETSESTNKIFLQKGIKHQYVEWCWNVTDFSLDLETASVNLEDGILTISASQKEEVKPRELKIK